MAWGRVASCEVKFESVKTAPPNGLDGFGDPKAERPPPAIARGGPGHVRRSNRGVRVEFDNRVTINIFRSLATIANIKIM